MGNRFGLYWFGAAGGSRTRTPIRTQAPQACQSTSSSTAADHSNSTSCLIIILRLALFVNSIFSPARKKTAKKVLTPGTSYGNIFLALNGAKPLARVVELVDSLASGASVRKDVRVRLPPRAPKKKHWLCQCFFFGFRRLWRLHPVYFICSGGVNPPGIKVLPLAKTLGTPHSRQYLLRLRFNSLCRNRGRPEAASSSATVCPPRCCWPPDSWLGR